MGTIDNTAEYLACPECDLVHGLAPLPAGARADCTRCGALLRRGHNGAQSELIALALGGLFLLGITLGFPLISIQAGGPPLERSVITAGTALAQHGMPELAFLVLLTSLACPMLVLGGVLYVVLPLTQNWIVPGFSLVLRVVHEIKPWSLLPVFLLGVLIAVVKLMPMVRIIPGPALVALLALVVVYGAFLARLDLATLWNRLAAPRLTPVELSSGTVRCMECSLLARADASRCARCDSRLHRRKPASLQTTTALLISAAILFVPANLLPVMTVTQLGRGHADTIMSGVMALASAGMYGLAFIVVVASLVVPLAKLGVLAMLIISVQQGWAWRPRDRTRLYRVTEAIGSWSMVDVYVVGLLTALVALGPLGGVVPGPGILYFAGVVVLTMLAAHAFDPRLIWDRCGSREAE